MALTLLPLLDVDRGAEAGVEAWCGHSLVGSEEGLELPAWGKGSALEEGCPRQICSSERFEILALFFWAVAKVSLGCHQ